MQRFFDIIFSSGALLVLSPIMVTCILILKFTGEKEIFYFQERYGLKGNKFKLVKFATMIKNSEKLGAGTITVQNDSRVLPFGKFLRKSKINELPQLINIFIGDMSVIGPRPLANKGFFYYSAQQRKIISSVRPGLSGMGSIAFRDEEKILNNFKSTYDSLDEAYRDKIIPIKAKLEEWYVANNSIYLYFKLIFMTILVVIDPNLEIKKFFPGIKYE